MIRFRDRKLRRGLTLLFVVSLLLNVQQVLACQMMSDMPDFLVASESDLTHDSHECCLGKRDKQMPDAPELGSSATDTCFILEASLQVKGSADSDADPGNDHALVKDKQGLEDLTFSMAVIVLAVLRVPRNGNSVVPTPAKIHQPPLPIYQATQRYRI